MIAGRKAHELKQTSGLLRVYLSISLARKPKRYVGVFGKSNQWDNDSGTGIASSFGIRSIRACVATAKRKQ